MGVVVLEQQQQQHRQQPPVSVVGIDLDKKKKRRPQNRWTKPNSNDCGSAFNSEQHDEAAKSLQNSTCTLTRSSSKQYAPNKESDAAFVSMSPIHFREQDVKHNLEAKDYSKSPTHIALNDTIRSSLDGNLLSPSIEGCSSQIVFDLHWSVEAVNEALRKAEVFKATFRVNAHNRIEAYCTIDGVPTDVLISGSTMQNRAIDGDIVAIIVDPPKFWSRMKGYNNYSSNPATSSDPNLSPETAEGVNRSKGKFKLDECEPVLEKTDRPPCGEQIQSGNDLSDGTIDLECSKQTCVSLGVEDSLSYQNDEVAYAVQKFCETISAFPSKRPTGRVVAIIEPSPRRKTIVGFLNAKQWLSSRENCGKSNKKKMYSATNFKTQYIQFSPANPRFPKMVVPVQGLPDSLKKRLNDGDASIEMELVGATIYEWGERCLLPEACIMHTFGRSGEMETHIASILFENAICCSQFSSESLASLPCDSWEIPRTELLCRRDIRDLCVFTIDPTTATDLDDALSIDKLSSTAYRVGVHIADVSYFVQPDTALDMEAQVRSTTVYLPHKKFPMLPPKLSDIVGSLTPGTDRLAFSIFWDIDLSGNIIDRWVGRTVIHSCCKLSYDHAEDILKQQRNGDNNYNPEQDCFPKLYGQFEWKDVFSSLRMLHEISKLLKAKRFNNGALVLEHSKMVFLLDEFGVPYESKLSERKDSNFLVEEFMLLANSTAAEIISRVYPESALLRRHPEPNMRKLKELEAFCFKHGLDLDASSSKSLRCSLERIKDELKDDLVLYDILLSNATKPMQLAKYFCTGDVKVSQDEWGHYALAVPFYTHFTSPLRRYPDIVVHRTLSAAIEAEHMYMKHQKMLGKVNQVEGNRCFTGITFDKLAAESVDGKEALSAAALKNRIPCTDLLLGMAAHCNQSKLACRHVKDDIDKLCMWVLVKNKQVLLSEARVLGLGPKFMSIYINVLAIERRIYYDEVEGLTAEWFESTSTLILSLYASDKRAHRRGSPGKCRPLEDSALMVSPLQLDPDTGFCAIIQNKDPITKSGRSDAVVEPTVFPITVGLLSTIPVAIHAVGSEIAARLYVSSYFV